MRLPGTVVALGLLAVCCAARAEEPPKKRPGPGLTEAQQARWDKARAILAKPDALELYSLDPVNPPGDDAKPQDTFRGWKVLGKTRVEGEEARKVVRAVVATIAPGYGAKCFEPRHAIRATAGGKSVDLVICFACSWVYITVPEESGKGGELVRLTIARDQQPALDKVLTDAKIPLPKGKE